MIVLSSSSFSIEKSNFSDNSIYNIQNLSTANISADSNYWGGDNVIDIRETIYDYYDDLNRGEVSINGYASSPFNIDVVLGNVERVNLKEGFKLYPNPSSTSITFETLGKPGLAQVYSLSGQLIHDIQLMAGVEQYEINVAGFDPGIYMMNIINDESVKSTTFIVD